MSDFLLHLLCTDGFSVYDFLDFAFGKRAGSMRSWMLTHSITDLNQVVNDVLRALSDDGQAHVAPPHELSAMLDATMQVTAALDATTGSAGVEYAKRSGGQRRRTDLAIFFGLLVSALHCHVLILLVLCALILTSPGLCGGGDVQELAQQRTRYRSQYIILDEIFDSLDQSGQDSVQRWIATLTRKLKKVFVISHSPTSAGRGPRILSVRMGARGTFITDSTGVMDARARQNAALPHA